MPDTFTCPNCGAPLDYKGSDPIIRCPYCNSSVIVPDNLREKPAFSSRQDNFTLTGMAGVDMKAMVNQARRFKEVKELAHSGKMDDAARLYMEITGADALTARSAVEALANGMPVTLTSLSSGPAFINTGAEIDNNIPETPVRRRTAKPKSGMGAGCVVGCFLFILAAGILISVGLPTLASLAGLVIGTQPELVLTSLPNLPISPTVASGIAKATGFGSVDLSIGGEGTGPGLFGDVRGIAVDPSTGGFFAADFEGGRVQAFDSQGKFTHQWIIPGKKLYILSITADREGNVYIATGGKILVFDKKGTPLRTIESEDIHYYYDDVAVLLDGSMLVLSRGDTLFHLAPDGKVLERYDEIISSITDDSELSTRIAVDGIGNIYLLGTFNNAVFIFDSEGKFKNKFGSMGDEPGQFRAPSAIGIDGKGRIFVSDMKGIQIFSNDGRYIDVLKAHTFAYGIAFDDQGRLYVTTNQKMVERYIIQK